MVTILRGAGAPRGAGAEDPYKRKIELFPVDADTHSKAFVLD